MYNMTKLLWVTGKTYIMEISLCVLKALVGIPDIDIYSSLLVKKFINMKTDIYGYEINYHGWKKSENECISGHWKGAKFYIFVVKNKKYNIIMMSTKYGIVVREGKRMNNKYQK